MSTVPSDQARLARQAHHLREWVGQFPEAQRQEITDREVAREVDRRRHSKRQVKVQPALDHVKDEHLVA